MLATSMSRGADRRRDAWLDRPGVAHAAIGELVDDHFDKHVLTPQRADQDERHGGQLVAAILYSRRHGFDGQCQFACRLGDYAQGDDVAAFGGVKHHGAQGSDV